MLNPGRYLVHSFLMFVFFFWLLWLIDAAQAFTSAVSGVRVTLYCGALTAMSSFVVERGLQEFWAPV